MPTGMECLERSCRHGLYSDDPVHIEAGMTCTGTVADLTVRRSPGRVPLVAGGLVVEGAAAVPARRPPAPGSAARAAGPARRGGQVAAHRDRRRRRGLLDRLPSSSIIARYDALRMGNDPRGWAALAGASSRSLAEPAAHITASHIIGILQHRQPMKMLFGMWVA